MKVRTRLLLGLTLTFTALIAWSALGPFPNSYFNAPDGLVMPPYPWNLPALSLVFGLTVTALLSFTKSSIRFFGSLISSCIGGSLVFLMLLTATRSPQIGHAELFFILLGWTIGLLIYSGFTLAVWLGHRKTDMTGDAE